MIAEISTDFPWQWVGWLFVGLAALSLAANQIFEFVGRIKGKPSQPPNEQLHTTQQDIARRIEKLEKELIGSEWFTKVDSDLAEIKSDLKKDRDDHEKHISVRASNIYAEMKSNAESLRTEIKQEGERRVLQIDDVRRELTASLENVRRELSENQRSLPNEIVTLLKNTNAI